MEQDGNKKRAKMPHAGHRQRLRNFYRTHGMDALKPYEIPELLLFYSIPVRDTQPYGRKLIERYKNISALLDADTEQLEQTEGISENSAILLNLMAELSRRYVSDKPDAPCLDSTAAVASYAEGLFENTDKTVLYMLCLDISGRLMQRIKLGEYDSDEIILDRKTCILEISRSHAANIFLIHNHPHASALPSHNDILLTENFWQLTDSLGVGFIDHIIFSGCTSYAMSKSGKQHHSFFRNL